MMTGWPGSWPVAVAILTTACISTSPYEAGARERLAEPPTLRAAGRVDARVLTQLTGDTAPRIDGSLDAYVALALREHPSLRASFETWRAAVHAIAEGRRLPDPMVMYMLELHGADAGHRVGMSQRIPWPDRRRARTAAAADMAEAAERDVEAQAIAVLARVADAYWRAWEIQRDRELEREHRALLGELAAVVRARIELGRAGLADAAQIELELLRRDDALAALDAREQSALAALRQAIGAPADMPLPIVADPPLAVVPAESDEHLREAARAHPRVTALLSRAASRDDAAVAARAQGRPDLMVGVEVASGIPEAHVPGMVMLSLGMSVPLWRRTYAAAETSARAEAAALRARHEDAALAAEAELTAALAEVRDAARRIALHEDTLIPQAESMHAAVIGSLQVNASSLASALMAQRSVLELRTQLLRARVQHARAWARLIQVVGRPVAAQEMNP